MNVAPMKSKYTIAWLIALSNVFLSAPEVQTGMISLTTHGFSSPFIPLGDTPPDQQPNGCFDGSETATMFLEASAGLSAGCLTPSSSFTSTASVDLASGQIKAKAETTATGPDPNADPNAEALNFASALSVVFAEFTERVTINSGSSNFPINVIGSFDLHGDFLTSSRAGSFASVDFDWGLREVSSDGTIFSSVGGSEQNGFSHLPMDSVIFNSETGILEHTQEPPFTFSGTSTSSAKLNFTGLPDRFLEVYAILKIIATDGNTADFSNTATFALDLPEGITFTSDSGVFLSTVPVPATLWLFLSSLFGLLVFKKKESFTE